jgi:hypothetical protein
MALGLELWTALRWHSVHWYPLAWLSAREWHLVQTARDGVGCEAWYLPLWQVRQLLTALLTLDACSALV